MTTTWSPCSCGLLVRKWDNAFMACDCLDMIPAVDGVCDKMISYPSWYSSMPSAISCQTKLPLIVPPLLANLYIWLYTLAMYKSLSFKLNPTSLLDFPNSAITNGFFNMLLASCQCFNIHLSMNPICSSSLFPDSLQTNSFIFKVS